MIRVKALGTVVHEAHFVTHIQGKPILIPVGYEVERSIFNEPAAEVGSKKRKPSDVIFAFKASSPSASQDTDRTDGDGVTFTAKVLEGRSDDGATKVPEFVITRSDDPERKRYTSDKSINAVWRAAVEDVERDFPEQKARAIASRDSKGNLQLNGARLFALTSAEVTAEIKKLPGAQEALAAFPPPPPASAAAGPSSSGGAKPKSSQLPQQSEGDVELELELAAPPINVDTIASQQAPPASATRPAARAEKVAAGKTAPRTAPQRKKASKEAVSAVVASDKEVSGSAPTSQQPQQAPTKRRRSRTASAPLGDAVQPPEGGEGVAAAADVPEAGGTVATDGTAAQGPPPLKRPRRPSAKKSLASSAVAPAALSFTASTGAAAAGATPTVCPACGLAGTPFCAATGQPHAPPPCSLCGLTTAFCPVSGLAHAGHPGRANRQRGEVHLPGKSAASSRRKKAIAPAVASTPEGVSEVTVITTQEGEQAGPQAKKPRAKRARKQGEDASAEGPGAAADSAVAPVTTEEGGTAVGGPAAKKPRASRKAAKAAAAAVATVPEGQLTLDAALVPKPLVETLEEPPKPKEYEYPALRPPLSATEQHRAAALQTKLWKERPEQELCPPHVAALHLPFVPYRAPARQAGAATKKRKGKHGEGDDEEAGTTGVKDEANAGEEEDVERPTNEEEDGEEGGRKPKKAATAQAPLEMIHPLEVREVGSSVAGKRLTKFLQLYTSERTKGELLRAAESEKKAAAAAKRASAKPALSGTTDTTNGITTVDGSEAAGETKNDNEEPAKGTSEPETEHLNNQNEEEVTDEAQEGDGDVQQQQHSMPRIESAAQE